MNKTLEDYKDQVSGPGKFENEPAYVPYYWDAYLNGEGENSYTPNDFMYTSFEITDADKIMFPELDCYSHIVVFEDTNGFVYCDIFQSKWDHDYYITAATQGYNR